MFESVADFPPIVDPQEAAASAGLRYISDARLGIRPRNPRFRKLRESTKSEHVVAFADALPGIRAQVRERMSLRGLSREKVVATVVHLLDATLIRIGNDDYVAARLGNTPTICRKCYVHPELVTSYLGSNFVLKVKSGNKLRAERSSLKLEEAAVLAMLRSQLGRESSSRISTATRNAPQIANIP